MVGRSVTELLHANARLHSSERKISPKVHKLWTETKTMLAKRLLMLYLDIIEGDNGTQKPFLVFIVSASALKCP